MATVVELAQRGDFEAYEPELRFRQQAERLIYGRQRVWEWIDKHLPQALSEYASEITPLEQLDDLLNAYCAGEPLLFKRQIKLLHHRVDGIWELKTRELRIFGWFPAMDVFIACGIDFATRIKSYGLYPGYRDEVIHFRHQLDLNPPKFLSGEDPRGVATNISVP